MEFYANCNVQNHFNSIEELRLFLNTCKYVSDKEQFNKEDYWMPPTDFEKSKKGDCEDFALYTWRQFIKMGFNTRFITGECTRYNHGHAWVTLSYNGNKYLVEPLASVVKKLPRFYQLRYNPKISVEFSDNKLKYYKHDCLRYSPAINELLIYSSEWILFYLSILPEFFIRTVKRLFRKKRQVTIEQKI
jgi:hypothetical protein